MLVISAHPADFVWRAGGTIASYIEQGHKVKIIVLSYGVRGESADLWKRENQTYESVAATRSEESKTAANILGVQDVEYWGYQDYPITFDSERLYRLMLEIRKFNPDIILTHDKSDAFNPDHNDVSEAVHRCVVQARSIGIRCEGVANIKQPAIYGFEPHQTEISGFTPMMFIDITDSYDKKLEAMKCFKSQSHLIEYYAQRAAMRGDHARHFYGGGNCKYAESFSRFFPSFNKEFV